MRRIFVKVMGAACFVLILLGLASGSQTSFEEEILEVLKTKGVITPHDYDRLIKKIRVEHKSVNEELLDLLRQKNIISSDQYASLSQKARDEQNGGVIVAQANPGSSNETQVAVAEVQEEGEKQKAEIQEAADDAARLPAYPVAEEAAGHRQESADDAGGGGNEAPLGSGDA